MFTRIISSCWINPFIIMKCALSLLIVFVYKSIFSDTSITAQAFLPFPFPQNIFFHPFTFSLSVFFNMKQVSCGQHIYGSYFLIHSTTLYLLFGVFNPLTFKVIIDRNVVIVILSFIFMSCPLPSAPSPFS
uniref:Uncharacterized protein n=1 Tax=Rousettus aegyptiacus TaxID=9407 RepID=A0A7J8E890_ROUAE|nr:hypothetical protein HJG63_008207 [Rousettus aegyptiacus]